MASEFTLLSEEGLSLPASQLPAGHSIERRINAVDLKYDLGQFEANGANTHCEWLLLLVDDDDHHFGASMPVEGAVHSICFASDTGSERRFSDPRC